MWYAYHQMTVVLLRYICYSPDGRSVLGKTVPEDKKAGKIFPNTHRPWLVNNIFIFSKT